MYTEIQEPANRLVKEIIPALRWSSVISHLTGFIVLAVLYAVSIYFSLGSWSRWILLAFAVCGVISAVWSIGLRPLYTYKNTRYGVDEEFLQLKTGAFVEQHELVPMTKIQAVSTHQGPILRKYNLYTVAVETMGSTHGISGLPKQIAIDLRNQIAHFAKIKEADE